MTLDLHQLATKNGFPSPDTNPFHTCTHCGAPVDCEWKIVVEARRRAASAFALAQRLEARMLGIRLGRKRSAEFTADEAKAALADLGSFNAVARKLGVSRQTVQRAIGQVPPSVAARTNGRG